MPKIVCPSCAKKMRLPDHLAGRRVMCTRCDAVIAIPADLVEVADKAPPPETAAPPEEDQPFPLPARLGIVALVLGMISSLLTCVPLVHYVSLGMSGVGLLLGLGGLFRARTDSEPLPTAVASGTGICGGFGTRVRDYPLAGVAACLIALLLILLPTLIQWLSEQG